MQIIKSRLGSIAARQLPGRRESSRLTPVPLSTACDQSRIDLGVSNKLWASIKKRRRLTQRKQSEESRRQERRQSSCLCATAAGNLCSRNTNQRDAGIKTHRFSKWIVHRPTHTAGIRTKGRVASVQLKKKLTGRRWKNFSVRTGDVWRQKLSCVSLRWEAKKIFVRRF